MEEYEKNNSYLTTVCKPVLNRFLMDVLREKPADIVANQAYEDMLHA